MLHSRIGGLAQWNPRVHTRVLVSLVVFQPSVKPLSKER